MAAVRPDEVTSILERELDSYQSGVEEVGVGTVLQVGDGVARIYGLRDAAVAELLEFPGRRFRNGAQPRRGQCRRDHPGRV